MPYALASATDAFAGMVRGEDLTPLILLPGIGMLIVGLGFLVFAWRRHLGMHYVLLGGVAWIVSVALKFAWAISLNSSLYTILMSHLPEFVALPTFEIYVGLLTGVFEVALVWLVLSRSRLGQAAWSQALAFGIGFGAIEAILLGLQALASGLSALLAPAQLSQAALAADTLANNPLFGLAPIIERAAIVWVHILSAALIFTGIATARRRWVWLAIGYKTAIDSVAAFAQFWGVETLGKYWTIEAIIIMVGLCGWWGTHQLAGRYPADGRPAPLEPETLPLA